MLEVQELNLEYTPHCILKNISFSVAEGKTLAIVGKSGCGKTSLLSAIAGILPMQTAITTAQNNDAPTNTRLVSAKKINSIAVRSYTTQPRPLLRGVIKWKGEARSGHANYMQQEDLLLPWLKIIDNVALPLRIQQRKYAISKAEARAIAKEFLQCFDMQAYAQYYPAQLSGGMRQRIALLRTCITISQQTEVDNLVLLDEPFARLDLITKQQCQVWARNILDTLQATVILVSHDIDEALSFADNIILLQSNALDRHSPAEIVYQTALTRATLTSTRPTNATTELMAPHSASHQKTKHALVRALQEQDYCYNTI